MPAIYALMHTGTHQTSYIRSVTRRGSESGRLDGETDTVRHKHRRETEKKLMDG